ncbi:MAG: hypothetical protein A2681_02185, partial [Candidatus Liptonbacteria bacterium RIFCSPHIGHO2_01_FULL_56_18b]
MNFRTLRVGNLIRDELGKLLIKEMELPGVVATITEVVVDKSMDSAEVRVSVIPSEKSEATVKVLRIAQGHLQYLLSKKLNIRPMPRIRFELDRGPEKAARVEKLLLE